MSEFSSSRSRVVIPGSAQPPLPGAVPAGVLDPGERVEVVVGLRRRAPLPVGQVGALSLAAVAERHGPDPADVAAVTAALAAAGVDVVSTDSAFSVVRARGSVGALAGLFGADLALVNSLSPQTGEQVAHRLLSGELSVPSELAGIVTGVLGLDNRPIARRTGPAVARPAAAPAKPDAASSAPNPSSPQALTVPQLVELYGFPQATGKGVSVALIEQGVFGYVESDLQTYFAQYKIPVPKITKNGFVLPFFSDDETTGDVEVLGAVAPEADISVNFFSGSAADFHTVVTTVGNAVPTPAVVSMSLGWDESAISASDLAAADDAIHTVATAGVTFCVASGDSGSEAESSSTGVSVVYPASSPYALAVGGTELVVGPGLFGGTPPVVSETVWNDLGGIVGLGVFNGGASGGGISERFPVPSWQKDVALPVDAVTGKAAAGRGVPDVAANASNSTPYNLYVQGKWRLYGGTSFSTPLWAGLLARIVELLGTGGKGLGVVQPLLYPTSSGQAGFPGFRVITQGGNGAYSAGPGWSACTGLGVPVGTDLLAVFQKARGKSSAG